MTENQKKILEMLAEKKISIEEAQRLLSLIDTPSGSVSEAKQLPRYLRVVVEPNIEAGADEQGERVNVRVPLALIRAGMKLTSLIPPSAAGHVNETLKEKGIDFDLRNLKTEDIEELVNNLRDLEVDVQSGKEKVRVYVE